MHTTSTRKWFAVALLITLSAGLQDKQTHGSELRFTPMVRAVQGAAPSVVNIHGKKTVRSDVDPITRSATLKQVNGMGSGAIIDERGYVITNYHVIDGVRRIQVTLHDGQTVTAKLVAHDDKTDLAIIKLNVTKPLSVIKVGTSDDLMLAEPVVAIGNAYGYKHTVTKGSVSGLARNVQVSDSQTYQNLIQTDASINPGNSGGPLINIDGLMIGINVAVRVGAQGIGFAIPVDEAMEVAARLIRVEQRGSVKHGVTGTTVLDGATSLFVVDSIAHGSAAEVAGLKPGDVITDVSGVKIARKLDFERAMIGRKSGDELNVSISRDGEATEVAMAITSTTTEVASTSSNRVWDMLGMKLAEVPDDDFSKVSTRYHGGLKVTAVREGSSAEKRGIRKGDVLVGLHIWETIKLENVTYILDRPDFKQFQPLKFYVLRGSETLYGHLVASR